MSSSFGEASGCLAVRRLVEHCDAPVPAGKAWVEMGVMRYEFDGTVQPQDIRKARNRFMDSPASDR